MQTHSFALPKRTGRSQVHPHINLFCRSTGKRLATSFYSFAGPVLRCRPGTDALVPFACGTYEPAFDKAEPAANEDRPEAITRLALVPIHPLPAAIPGALPIRIAIELVRDHQQSLLSFPYSH